MKNGSVNDPSLTLASGVNLSLPATVAAGKLFVLNQRGEFEGVILTTYWSENNLLTVCSDGYEFNEDGDTVRDWR